MAKNYWTEEDDKTLVDNYLTKTDKEIGDLIGRTEAAIKFRRLTMGLIKNNLLFTPESNEASAMDNPENGKLMNQRAAKYLIDMLMNITQDQVSVISSNMACELGEFYTLKVEFVRKSISRQ